MSSENTNTPKPGASLAAMAQEAAHLEAQLITFAEEHYGEVNPHIEALMQEIDAKIAEKVDAYVFIMDRLEVSAELLATQAEKFNRAARSLIQVQKAMKERVKFAMTALGKDEVIGANWRFALVRSAPKVEVNEDQLPIEYTKQVSQVVPDREKILAAVKAGTEVAGVQKVEVKALRTFVRKGD